MKPRTRSWSEFAHPPQRQTINAFRPAPSVSALALMMLAYRSISVCSFSPSLGPQNKVPSAVFFRRTDGVDFAALTSDPEAAAAAASLFNLVAPLPVPVDIVDRMPSWLSQPLSHLAESNLIRLREAMLSSYLTQLDVDKVVAAIREAADGDDNKVAGAAEFCLILVDTMEMGVAAMVAAAFHFCTCVNAREKFALQPLPAFSPADFWDVQIENTADSGLQKYGEQAVLIGTDAARLKRTEMVAASVIQSSFTLRSRFDSKDAMNLRSMLLSESRDWRALAIRSAACLFRLRGLITARGKETKLTLEEIGASREALHIFAPLASRLGLHRLKNELEGAAFRLLYRRQYQAVTSLSLYRKRDKNVLREHMNAQGVDREHTSTVGESMKSVLSEVTDKLTELLKSDHECSRYATNLKVSARVKEPFSLWRKMLRTRASSILDVPDSLALRVVFDAKKRSPTEAAEVTRARERALCYYIQKACTDRWTPLKDGRFKDYIVNPKANGYQSLHYTAKTSLGGQDWPFEIQVRSGEMHQVAEYGLAAHFDYKDQVRPKAKTNDFEVFRLDHSSDAYLRSVQEWHWQQQQQLKTPSSITNKAIGSTDDDNQASTERVRACEKRLAPYIEALSAVQSRFAREQVFVFLSSSLFGNKVLALPAGSCVLDALREMERKFGATMRLREDAVHNGVLTNMTQKLCNGDIVTVPIMK